MIGTRASNCRPPAFAAQIASSDTFDDGRVRDAAATVRPPRADSAPAVKVLAVGFFPPPVDGQRLITKRMHDALDNIATVARLELDPTPRLGALSKVFSVGRALVTLPLARTQGYDRLYIAPHSGAGLLYSSVIVALARALGFRLYVHYHSFKNMSDRTPLMAAFVRLCGADATHIVLGSPMASGLRRHYPEVREISTLSNAIFMPERTRTTESSAPRLRIGHLSNLSRAKGLVGVLDCMRRLLASGTDAELVLAGPPTDEESRRLLEEALAEFDGRIRWLGRIGQSEICRFYEQIDVFLFPTLYKHEAEPLVIIEALSFGVPVLATDRGCIRSLVGQIGGHVFEAEEFAAAAVEQIRAWAEDRECLDEASAGARTRFLEVRDQSRSELTQVLATIADAEEEH